ncbi:hypothetical protein [Halomarina litorea]|uniref:hypothetical protein n=1 Tax=Halomarina litorea TaxID=2961595 RepID=UPI0020C1F249|nr:hypothetical protein [Halomarina sp. BCD28]
MQRRTFLTVTSASLIASIAGCASEDGGNGSGDTDSNEDSNANGSTTTQTQTTTKSETDSGSSGGSDDLRVRIQTEGAWSGSVGSAGSSSSVEGSGNEVVDVEDSADIISATIQKEADDSSKLTVQILRGEEVLKESSTSSSYGVASVSSMTSGSGSNSGDSSDGANLEVRIQYDGQWTGSISAGGSARSVDGSGTETIDIDDSASIVSANAQKQDDRSGTLTIQILSNGEVLKESSTSAAYGVASVTASG